MDRYERMRREAQGDNIAEIVDAPALDRINYILSDPDWGVGMLEDICAIVRNTGRTEVKNATWERH